MPVSSYTEQHLLDQVFSLQAALLSTALTAGQTSVTSLACATETLGEAVSSGDVLLVSWGTANVEAFTASAAASIGATSIAVTSQTSAKAHAVGDLIVRFPRFVAPSSLYVALFEETGQLNESLVAGTAYTSITVMGALGSGGLTNAVASGDVIYIGTAGEFVVASAAAAIGATSISIASFVPKGAYAAGAALLDITTPVEPTSGTGGYARPSYSGNLVNWPAATGHAPAQKQNAVVINFAQSTGAWSSGTTPLAGFALMDALTAGNQVWVGFLTTPQTVNAANITPQFPADSVTPSLS